HGGGYPLVALGSGVGHIQLHNGVGIVFKDQGQLHGNIIFGGLLKGQVNLGAFGNVQVGLVQVQEVLSVDCTIDNQRGTAVISTDQVKVKAAFVTQNVFGAVVIILLVL